MKTMTTIDVKNLTPLRYPGGKGKLAHFISDCVKANGLSNGTYVEPYAGGAAVALYLLLHGDVKNIVINDLDRGIYAFWWSVLNATDELCHLVQTTPITIEEREQQREIQQNKACADLLSLGFSTLFLNRVNRSGIITAGVIGGKNQTGKWKMDARFNRTELIKRIQTIAAQKERIALFNKDCVELISSLQLDDNTLIYYDPPYYDQGSSLYTNFYKKEDHESLSHFIQKTPAKWVLTYDMHEKILEFYRGSTVKTLNLSYSATTRRRADEIIAFSPGFLIPKVTSKSISIQ